MRNSLILLLLALSTLAHAKPNFLIITADDMNWDSLGCYSSAIPNTSRHIDQLAAEGIRFHHTHVTTL